MYSARMLIYAIVLLSLMVPAVSAAPQASVPQVAGKPADVQYPFIAEVTGNNVYIRSGKGPLYYQCGKLNAGSTVTVVEDADGWSKIVPPEGSYSWIHKDYVKVAAGSNKGEVIGENVRVWAGSDFIEASRSDSMQVKLNKNKDQIDEDDFVELFADQPENSAYYKIKPPAGAFLWVSSEFLKYVGPLVHKTPVAVPPRPDANEIQSLPPAEEKSIPAFGNLTPEGTPDQAAPVQEPAPKEAAVPAPPAPKPVTKESQLLKQCYELSAKIDEQLKKPLGQQNYADISKSLEAIKSDPEAGKAAAYSQILLDRIARYELAISVTDIVKQQDEALAAAKEQIEKAHQAQLSKLPKTLDFLFVGTLKPSYVYTDKTGQKRYVLTDGAGKILCYVTAATPEAAARLEQAVDTQIGIRGTIVSDSKSLVTLVSASAVEAMP